MLRPYSPPNLLVFAHIQKTAGTTVKWILRNSFGLRHVDAGRNKKARFTREDFRMASGIFPLPIHAISGHNLIEPTKEFSPGEASIFTILREPLTRCASFYQDSCVRGNNIQTFESWIKVPENQNMQVRHIAGEESVEKAIELLSNRYFLAGLTERFDDSMKLLKLLSPQSVNIHYRIKKLAPDNTIKRRLLNDPGSIALLRKYNEKDLLLYRYVEQELFPCYLRDHEDSLARIDDPHPLYKNSRTLNYQAGLGYNKFVYRQIIKLRKATNEIMVN